MKFEVDKDASSKKAVRQAQRAVDTANAKSYDRAELGLAGVLEHSFGKGVQSSGACCVAAWSFR